MNNVESTISKGIEKILLQFKEELNSKGISYDLSFNNSGKGGSYFSELEVTFWKDDNILDEISIVIYLEGKKRNTEEIFINWFKDELEEVIAVS
jgi:hypothetical protein